MESSDVGTSLRRTSCSTASAVAAAKLLDVPAALPKAVLFLAFVPPAAACFFVLAFSVGFPSSAAVGFAVTASSAAEFASCWAAEGAAKASSATGWAEAETDARFRLVPLPVVELSAGLGAMLACAASAASGAGNAPFPAVSASAGRTCAWTSVEATSRPRVQGMPARPHDSYCFCFIMPRLLQSPPGFLQVAQVHGAHAQARLSWGRHIIRQLSSLLLRLGTLDIRCRWRVCRLA